MAEFINTSVVIGDDALVDSIIQRTITEYKEDRITKVGQYAFYGCTALTTVDVPNVENIEANSFKGCSSLTALILRGAVVCSLDASALTGTPIAKGTGYTYIPGVLYDSYASATNWATHSAQLRKLEDYTVDGTITGELDESKI